MNTRHHAHHARHQPHARAVGARAMATTIEWEELPSLAAVALQRADALRRTTAAQPVWNATAPMPLAMLRAPKPPRPFREPLNGLHVREIEGHTVFDHFFGD